GIRNVQIALIERHLPEILRVLFCESVTFDFAPAFGVERFVLPHRRIDQILQSQPRNQHSISMSAQRTIDSAEGESFERRELESCAHSGAGARAPRNSVRDPRSRAFWL